MRLALVLLLFPFASMSVLPSCHAPRAEVAAIRVVNLRVTGMTCAVDCPPRVRAALESVPGVESAAVDYDTRTARVTCREGTPVDALVAALLAQGFGATPL